MDPEEAEHDAEMSELNLDGAIEAARRAAVNMERAGDMRVREGNDAEAREARDRESGAANLVREDICKECESFYRAAEDYALASRLQSKLGNYVDAVRLSDKAREHYEKAAGPCERCGDFAFEQADRDAAEAAYRKAERSIANSLDPRDPAKFNQSMAKISGIENKLKL